MVKRYYAERRQGRTLTGAWIEPKMGEWTLSKLEQALDRNFCSYKGIVLCFLFDQLLLSGGMELILINK